MVQMFSKLEEVQHNEQQQITANFLILEKKFVKSLLWVILAQLKKKVVHGKVGDKGKASLLNDHFYDNLMTPSLIF